MNLYENYIKVKGSWLSLYRVIDCPKDITDTVMKRMQHTAHKCCRRMERRSASARLKSAHTLQHSPALKAK